MSQKKPAGFKHRASLSLSSGSNLMKPGASIDEQPEEECCEAQLAGAKGEPIAACETLSQSQSERQSQTIGQTCGASWKGLSLAPSSGAASHACKAALCLSQRNHHRHGQRSEQTRSQKKMPNEGEETRPSAAAFAQGAPVAEYRASLQPVYEPKHYLANCTPIQFIPLAHSRKRRQSSFTVAPQLASGAGSTLAPASDPMLDLRIIRHQRSLPAVCQIGGGLYAPSDETSKSELPSSLSPAVTSEAQTSDHRHIVPKHHPSFGSVSFSDQSAPLPSTGRHFGQRHANSGQPANSKGLRRYSTCIANHHHQAEQLNPNRRHRRLSVLNPTLNGTSTSCPIHQTTLQEIKVTPTQASSGLRLRSGRRHTLADVTNW